MKKIQKNSLKKFNVLIEETLAKNIIVEARDEDHADEIVRTLYNKEVIVLTEDDYSDALIGGEYTVLASPDDKVDFRQEDVDRINNS